MKRIFYFAAAALAACAVMVSCEKDEPNKPDNGKALAAPKLSVETTENSFTVSWEAVANAENYSYVFQSEAEETTSETSVTFSNLENGTYTVKVKANAPAGSEEYTDSKYAETSATIGVPSDLTFTITVTDVTYNSANVNILPSDMSASYTFFVGYQSDIDSYTTPEEYVAAMIAQNGFDIYTGEQGGTISQLTQNTEFVAVACGIDNSGTVTSEVAVESFTTETAPADTELDKWVGEWTATFEKTLVWTEGAQYLETSVEDRPMTRTLTMEINPDDPQQLLIYGWTVLDDAVPAFAMTAEDGVSLAVYSGYQVGDADSQGFAPTWAGTSELNGQVTLITGQYPAYTLTLNGEEATSTLYEGQLQDQTPFTTLGLEIYALGSGQYSIYAETLPLEQPVGNVTLTKNAASSAKSVFTLSKKAEPVMMGVFPASFDFLLAE